MDDRNSLPPEGVFFGYDGKNHQPRKNPDGSITLYPDESSARNANPGRCPCLLRKFIIVNVSDEYLTHPKDEKNEVF